MSSALTSRKTRADDDDDIAGLKQYLTFTVGQETCALHIAAIREILRNVQIATVPMMPAHIQGVINLRGAVLPVVDLAVLFGRAPIIVTKRSSVIVLDLLDDEEPLDVGIMVDAVSAVIEIPDDQIEAVPSFGTPLRADFIESIAKVDGSFVIILNVERTFSLKEMAPLLGESNLPA